MTDPVVFQGVEKHYGGLRPLRVRDLRVAEGSVAMLVGFDRPAAEIFVNLLTGAALPDAGEVTIFGRPTRTITDSAEWLPLVERFGIVSERIVLLEAMTIAQNLAISFDLALEPVPPHVMPRVIALASEVGLDPAALERRVAEAGPFLRAQVYLARALALDPAVLVLEHPTAGLEPGDAERYGAIVQRVAAARRLTTIGILMDERFAKAAGGRLLNWQPATGEMRERSILRFWRRQP